MTTRNQKVASYKHLIENVLGLSLGDDIPTALAADGCDSITGILGLDPTNIQGLRRKATDDQGNNIIAPLKRGDQGMLSAVISYALYQAQQGTPISIKDWISVTSEEFDEYRVSTHYISNVGRHLTTSSSAGPGTGNNTKSSAGTTSNAISDFRKGIKRDVSLFPMLKDDKQWQNWRNDTLAQARYQGVDDVLNSTYKPSTPDDRLLFDEHQKFMYAVFVKALMTDQGKALVRDYANTYDAQQVYAGLVDYQSKSTKASIEASSIMEHITSTSIGDGRFKGTTQGFILNWCNQMRKYEDITPVTAHLGDDVKKGLLQKAVKSVNALQAVQAQADQHQVHTGSSLTFEQYKTLLIGAAQAYDDSNRFKNGKHNARRVYSHQMDDDQGSWHNIDTSVYDLDQVDNEYFVMQAFQGPKLNRSQWDRLDPSSQKTWDQLDNRAKKIILEGKLQHNKDNNSGTPSKETRKSNVHEQLTYEDTTQQEFFFDASSGDSEDSHGDVLIRKIMASVREGKSNKPIPTKSVPGDISKVLSTNATQSNNDTRGSPKEMHINGIKYRQVSQHVLYQASPHSQHSIQESLVDRGCNGGICGKDVRVLGRTGRTVDIQGIDNHRMSNMPIVTAGAVVRTQKGEIIVILHQYAYSPTGRTIHSCTQIEAQGHDVNDRSIKVQGGLQRILTAEGYSIPMNFRDGLAYIAMRPFNDTEWDTLPHVFLTGEQEWTPNIFDNNLVNNEEWFDAQSDSLTSYGSDNFNETGEYKHRVIAHSSQRTHGHDAGYGVVDTCTLALKVNNKLVSTREPDYDNLRKYFGWIPVDVLKKTYQATTRMARLPMTSILRRHFRSPYPALNVRRRQEAVATDTVFSDTPAIDNGATAAQFYVGHKSLVTDVFGIKTDKEFLNTLEDVIRKRGAPERLLSDRAQAETSDKVKDILRAYAIGDWQSEPHQQQQNPAERRYQTAKRMTNTIMERSGSPPSTWLLALLYVCHLLNHLAHPKLRDRTPLEALTGITPDVSPFLRFYWWQPVLYLVHDSSFPSDSTEKRGRFVGIAENVGHAMTYKILTDDTNKIIYRSNVRHADNPNDPNLKAGPIDGEPGTIFIKSRNEMGHNMGSDEANKVDTPALTTIQPEDMIGRTFLLDPQPDGQRFRAKVINAIEEHEVETTLNPKHIKFRCSVNNDQYEETVAYQDIIDKLEADNSEGNVWKFKRITGHQGPLTSTHPNYKGSRFNVMVEWETGEVTAEPLSVIAADDPVSCAIYARDNDLLHHDGWRRFRGIAKRQKKLTRMINQAKLRSFRTAPKYMFGVRIPRNYKEAVELDKANGNTKWQDCTALEMKQLMDYDTFMNKGKGVPIPTGHKLIRVHLVYAVKHDGRHKARLVADGHLTDVPVESVYSGVVSLRGLRMMIFLAELNQLHVWATDIGNAYLEATTKEKLAIIAGPEFGELQGHVLVIHKALYGLRTSGLRWHERLSAVLKEEGFSPCWAEPDLWMRNGGDVYEYVAVYVDDLAMAMKEPHAFTKTLQDKYDFKLKGTGEINFHLGADFSRDNDGTLTMAPRKYIERMGQTFERMFGSKPRTAAMSPLEKGDNPELDVTDFLDAEGIQKYQSVIGSLQWAVSLGRFDIATAVMTLSSFRSSPRKGHLERAKRVVGYLMRMKNGAIRFRTEEPDMSDVPITQYDWAQSIYGDVHEALPHNMPEPKGKGVTLVHYVDANLYHCAITGRSVTGILHLVNKTPMDWYSKKQATVETATYGSEFVAARTAVEQIIDLRNTLRFMGVRINGPSFLFGDNESVVGSSIRLDAKLHKRHNALSFHRVRETIAAGFITFNHIPSECNPSDVLSKHWGYGQVWSLLRVLLFWWGDTHDTENKDNTADTENKVPTTPK